MASSIDEATVRHVAHLARLKLTDDEISQFARQLSSILDYVRQLNELDTEGVEPTAHALPIKNVFRKDTISPSWRPEQALHDAPDTHGDFFRVPKVFDQQQENA